MKEDWGKTILVDESADGIGDEGMERVRGVRMVKEAVWPERDSSMIRVEGSANVAGGIMGIGRRGRVTNDDDDEDGSTMISVTGALVEVYNVIQAVLHRRSARTQGTEDVEAVPT